MKNQDLEKQAWKLYFKLSQIAYPYRTHEKDTITIELYRHRCMVVANKAYDRWIRRENNLFNYNPDGFAPSPALPSGL